jgi:hypothetical protein
MLRVQELRKVSGHRFRPRLPSAIFTQIEKTVIEVGTAPTITNMIATATITWDSARGPWKTLQLVNTRRNMN